MKSGRLKKKKKNPGDLGMGSGEREIGSKSSSLPQDPGDLAGLYTCIHSIRYLWYMYGTKISPETKILQIYL